LKKLLFTLTAAAASFLLLSQGAMASPWYTVGSIGADVGYPNCKTKLTNQSFGIVGVTGGLVYSHNNCLAGEARKFSNLSLYVNTGLNTSASSAYYTQAQAGCNGDVNCAAYNYGYNAALDAISYAQNQGAASDRWWLDVETSNSWSASTDQNQQSLQGEYDALLAHGAAMVGVYSTTAQWQDITGGWQNSWANWGATTWTTAKQAQTYCTGHQFTGGPSLLMQYKAHKSKFDQDIAC
jgi:hypothetical protein